MGQKDDAIRKRFLSVHFGHLLDGCFAVFLFACKKLESRRRRTKGSVVGEEWCQNAAPLG